MDPVASRYISKNPELFICVDNNNKLDDVDNDEIEVEDIEYMIDDLNIGKVDHDITDIPTDNKK
jgi:hypothetical protein